MTLKSVNVRPDRKRVLALSKDHGSVQSIVPVVAALKAKKHAVSLLLPNDRHDVATMSGMTCETLDDQAFSVAPETYIAKVFDEANAALLLTGSSPARGGRPETPEQYAIREARRRNIPSVAVLDYWGMYEERFCSNDGSIDHTLLPDMLCALDHRCREDLLRLGVPPERVVITHNPWLDSVVRHAYRPPPPSKLLNNLGLRVLFVSQPLTKFIQTEPSLLQHELLELLVNALPQARHHRHHVLVWKHPAEPVERWQGSDRFSSPNVEVCVTEERSSALLAHVDLVVSVHSTTAFEALHLGTPCLSLRMGLPVPQLYIDELGLSKTIDTHEELRVFLGVFSPNKLRQQLVGRSKYLCDKDLFFSDGKAADRVMALVLRLIE